MVSVVINTLNEEKTIRGCLESVRWADEIVVVDMHSSDGTVDIAREYTDRVFFHRQTGYVEPARNFAISQARGEWILILDADERTSPGFREAIEKFLADDDLGGVRFPRRNLYGDRWLRCCGWYPDHQLRLFRRGRVTYSEIIHRKPRIHGKVVTVGSKEVYLIHHAFADLRSRFERLNEYSSVAAEGFVQEGREVTVVGLFFRPLGKFLSMLFLKGGILHGKLGVILSFERMFYDFLKCAKLWELKKSKAMDGNC